MMIVAATKGSKSPMSLLNGAYLLKYVQVRCFNSTGAALEVGRKMVVTGPGEHALQRCSLNVRTMRFIDKKGPSG
jgi:hypothetical protein